VAHDAHARNTPSAISSEPNSGSAARRAISHIPWTNSEPKR
jgi:hypothetical protein